MTLHRPIGFVLRSMLLFGLWLLLLEPESFALGDIGPDWAVGAVTAGCAALLSMRLLPPARHQLRLWPLLRFVVRFLVQSLLAGLGVARRALDPRLPVAPGLLRQPTALPEGTLRALFGAVSSQVPGTICVDSAGRDLLLYHCLDQGPEAARALAADEALLLKALGQGDSGAAERRA